MEEQKNDQKKVCSNTHECTCPNTDCPRHGICCDCVAHHKKMGGPPLCIQG